MSCFTPPDTTMLTAAAVARTREVIASRLRRTPVLHLDRAELGLAPGPLVLKLEQLQHAGSFKARGALANLLLRPVPEAGVVAASGGNHGAAVAYAARSLGIPATIFVPEVSSPAKIERIRGYGARLVVTGDSYADALAASQAYLAESGAMSVHAFDEPETILGAGTLGLELLEQAPQVGMVVAAVGGGGLLSGIATAVDGAVPVVAVEPEGAPTLARALAAGEPVEAPVGSVAVDSLAPRRIGDRTYAVLSRWATPVVLVDDEEIRAAQRTLWELARVVAEPGGCAAFAAVLSGRLEVPADTTVAVVVSGANTTLTPAP